MNLCIWIVNQSNLVDEVFNLIMNFMLISKCSPSELSLVYGTSPCLLDVNNDPMFRN